MALSNNYPSNLLGDAGNPMHVTTSGSAEGDILHRIGPTSASLAGNIKQINVNLAASFGPFVAGEVVSIGANVDHYFRFAVDADTAQLTSASNGIAQAGFNPRDWEVPSGSTFVGIVGVFSGSGSVFKSTP